MNGKRRLKVPQAGGSHLRIRDEQGEACLGDDVPSADYLANNWA